MDPALNSWKVIIQEHLEHEANSIFTVIAVPEGNCSALRTSESIHMWSLQEQELKNKIEDVYQRRVDHITMRSVQGTTQIVRDSNIHKLSHNEKVHVTFKDAC